jgi:hypothetical protein
MNFRPCGNEPFWRTWLNSFNKSLDSMDFRNASGIYADEIGRRSDRPESTIVQSIICWRIYTPDSV